MTAPCAHAQAFDVIVVGAGPAGIAAAIAAAAVAGTVLVLDDNHVPGGQIWRAPAPGHRVPSDGRARTLTRLRQSGVIVQGGCRVFAAPGPGILLAYEDATATTHTLHYRRLILATGARERFLPFPGWTLPGVLGAGGLQALVQGGYPVRGRRIVVAGTGPLLLAVAAHLRQHGARIAAVAEQAPATRLARFAVSLARRPGRLLQALRHRLRVLRTPMLTNCWPLQAIPDTTGTRLAAVRLTNGRSTWAVPCDLLACGFHLAPNTELASLLGIPLRDGFVPVSPDQQTTLAGVYCAGEPTGIAGVDAALLTGTIAGRAAVGRGFDALLPRARAWRRFAERLAGTFALRPELRRLAAPATPVCRCEDVPFHLVKQCGSWTEAKLHTRCGMGPCQGRICGPATEFLFGWQPGSIRPPLFPVPLHAFAPTDAEETACTGSA